MTGPQRGLFWPVEKVAEVGVLKSPGEGGAVVLPVRATIRFERHARSGIGHDERRRPATGISDIIARGYRAYASDARRGQRLGMPTPSGRNAPCRRCSGSAGLAHSVSPDLPLEPGSGGRKRVHWNVFVDMHRLRMLPQVIKARKAPRAVTLERALASVFPNSMVSHCRVCKRRDGWPT